MNFITSVLQIEYMDVHVFFWFMGKNNAISRGIKVPFSNFEQGLSMALVKDSRGPYEK